jgi:ASC-1-like (ASCH) protein
MELRDKIMLSVRREDSFRAIKDRLKLGEVRLFRGFIRSISAGDIISIVHSGEEIDVRVFNIVKYDTLDEMLLYTNGCGILGKNNLNKEYYQEFYKKEDLDRYPVVVIMFNIL